MCKEGDGVAPASITLPLISYEAFRVIFGHFLVPKSAPSAGKGSKWAGRACPCLSCITRIWHDIFSRIRFGFSPLSRAPSYSL